MGVGFFGAGIKCGLGFGRIVASLYAIKTIAKPRMAPIPTQGA
jgi:hypothetical protein